MYRILSILFLLSLNNPVFGQVNIQNTNDAKNFLHHYLSPLGESLGFTLNNGWYNTARAHKFAGFDATITLNMLSVPDVKKSFNPNMIENFSSDNIATPTIMGKGNGGLIEYNGESFQMPNQESAISFLALPTFNVGVGIFKKTEINARYLPTYKYGEGFIGRGEVNMWGIGFKHDILQWIPIIGDAIPLSLSIQGGYTQLNSQILILSQAAELNVQAMNANLILSRNFLMLTGYASIGYNSATTTFLAGENLPDTDYFNIDDVNFDTPIEMVFESKNKLRSNIGVKLTLAVVAIHANYTFSEYPVATIGVGVSLR